MAGAKEYLAIVRSLIELSYVVTISIMTKLVTNSNVSISNVSIVVMGVSGCGKTSLAAAIAEALNYPMLEGDVYHSAASQAKMANGNPLTDADRAGWLQELGQQLAANTDGVVLSCSALKKTYRDTLRSYKPNLCFVYLDISPATALARVASRTIAGSHFFPATLVDNQFATLEVPTGEAGVLTVDATAPLDELVAKVQVWLG
jgi:gluconokinase